MRRLLVATVALGVCSACHHRKPKRPKPKAQLEVTNTCESSAAVVFGTTAEADGAIEVELEPGETLVWKLEAGEHAWSRDDADAEWVAAVDEGDELVVVSMCVSARF